MSTELHPDVRNLIHRNLRQQHGAQSLGQRSGPPGSIFTTDEPIDYLAGVETALRVERIAAGIKKEYGNQARGHGKSWAQIAEVMGFKGDDDSGASAAEQAFLAVAPSPLRHFDMPATSRRCQSCRKMIRDRGPEAGNHPADVEQGHADDCPRHQRAIAAWRAQND